MSTHRVNHLFQDAVKGIASVTGLLVAGAFGWACFDSAPRPARGERQSSIPVQAEGHALEERAEHGPPSREEAAQEAPAGQVAGCPDGETVPVFAEGRLTGRICAGDAPAQGLTVIDLSDDWVPYLFGEDAGEAGQQPYRATYQALARGDFGPERAPEYPWEQAREDRYFELYGIPPVFSLLRARLMEDARHACREAVDSAAIKRLSVTMREESVATGRARLRSAQALERALEHQRKRRGLSDMAELAGVNKYYARQVTRYEQLQTMVNAVTAVQEHLVCENLLERDRIKPGIYDWRTAAAVGAFQRKSMYLADEALGEYTREAFLIDSREADVHAVLRVLRERVVDATGLIEDGSAREEWDTVLGRSIDSPVFREPTGQEAPEHGAPDLISQFTEAAARELGWVSFAAMRELFAEHMGDGPIKLRVAVKLPALPAYHGPEMELHAVIDRGDVWYDFPGGYGSGCLSRTGERHAVLTLYTVHEGQEIALLRWHTTIGGWNRELMPGGWVALRYKNSDVGTRYWRDLIASPAWFPPASTPDKELVERRDRRVRLKYATFGPGYRSAYGLMMLIHHELVKRRDGEVFEDNGIRTHGSANFSSIIRGCSHGCHRLFNHQAVRLGSFLLKHRRFVRHGAMQSFYERTVRAYGKTLDLKLRSRGYRYELTPPVVVEVTQGRIRGRRRTPIKGAVPLRRD